MNVIKLESPMRIDFTSEEQFNLFMQSIAEISEKFNVSIEEPLPDAKKYRGIYKAVFLDKELMTKPSLTYSQLKRAFL